MTNIDYIDILKLFDEDVLKPFELVKHYVLNILGFDTKIKNVTYYCSMIENNLEFLIEYFVEYERPRESGYIGIKIINSENPIQILKKYYEKEREICKPFH